MFISLDLETTGLDKRKNQITEFGGIKFSLDPKQKTETLQTLINPGVPIPEFITHITNIKNDDVADAPPLEDVKQKIGNFIGDLPIIGHFISFDTDFLKEKGIPINNPLYDTAEIARVFMPGLPSYSLEILSEILQIEHLEKHRALDDSIAAQELFLKLIEEIQTLPKLLFDEIKDLCSKSTWDFAEVIKTLEHKDKKDSESKTTTGDPHTTGTTSAGAEEKILSAKKSQLIEIATNPETLAINLAEKAKGKTIILTPFRTFTDLKHPNKISELSNYISLKRLEIFKRKGSFNQPEITALIKTLIWLTKTENGLLIEGLNFSFDEKTILPYIQASTENLTDTAEDEPFLQKALKKEQETKVLISDHSYLPKGDTNQLIIIDDKAFINALQSKYGHTATLKRSAQPIKSLKKLLGEQTTQEENRTLNEILEKLDVLFGIIETTLERNTTPNPYFPQPLEITALEIQSSNWQKLRDLTQNLINTSQQLAEMVTEDTLPFLKNWKEVLKTLTELFNETNLQTHHIWIQKSWQDEIIIRKIPISLEKQFNQIKEKTKKYSIVSRCLDAKDDASMVRTILGISDKTDLETFKPEKSNLDESQIFLAEDIPAFAKTNMEETVKFIEKFVRKEKGQTVIILNSLRKIEQIQTTLAPKLKKEGLTLLAQRGSGGVGKIMELYKSDPENTTLLLTPNIWGVLEMESIKNIVVHAIPFDPPSDQYLAALGKNFGDSWNEFSLPSGLIALKKIIGKYLYSNKGQIIILDSRIIQKNYSSRFISALSDFVKPEQATIEQILQL
jgi:DNA polymerase III epsilon subunit-like protein/Rad3-related DNA helicase